MKPQWNRYMPYVMVVCCAILLAVPSSPAMAATTLDVLDKQRQVQPEPKSQPRMLLQEEPASEEPDDSVRFRLSGLELTGTTPDDAAKRLQPYLAQVGQEVSFTAVRRMAAELTRTLRDEGFVLSRVIVPPQEVDAAGAVVRLHLIEGYVESVVLEGEPDFIERFQSYFASQKAHILGMKPLYHPDFERIMLLLQDVPGLTISSSFVPGEQPGGSVLQLAVERTRFGGNVNIDNTGTKSSGPVMLNLGASMNTLPVIGAQTTVSYGQASTFDEYFYWQVGQSYRMASGLAFQASYSQSASPKPDTDFARMFDYETSSRAFSLGASYPIIRSRDMNLTLGGTFNYRDSYSDLLGRRNTNDHLRHFSFSTSFDMADEWGGVNQAVLDLARGLPWFRASNDSLDSSRPLARDDFHRATLYLSRNQSLWDRFSLFVAGQAQLTDSPLFSYDQYSLGGNQFGRGYDSGALSGDMALATSAELRWTGNAGEKLSFQPFAFVDWGQVRNRSMADLPGRWESLSSVGGGLRVWLNNEHPWPRLFASIYAGKALQHVPGLDTGSWRVVGQLGVTF